MSLKIKVPLTAAEIYNLMKGSKVKWDNIPHDKDKEVFVCIEVYGSDQENNIWNELFQEYESEDIYKFGGA